MNMQIITENFSFTVQPDMEKRQVTLILGKGHYENQQSEGLWGQFGKPAGKFQKAVSKIRWNRFP